MRRYNIYRKCHRQTSTNHRIPIRREICITSMKNRKNFINRLNKLKVFLISINIKINKQDYNRNIYKLHEANFQKSTQWLTICSVIFLTQSKQIEDKTDKYIDTHSGKRWTPNGSILLNELISPFSAILSVIIWIYICKCHAYFCWVLQ